MYIHEHLAIKIIYNLLWYEFQMLHISQFLLNCRKITWNHCVNKCLIVILSSYLLHLMKAIIKSSGVEPSGDCWYDIQFFTFPSTLKTNHASNCWQYVLLWVVFTHITNFSYYCHSKARPQVCLSQIKWNVWTGGNIDTNYIALEEINLNRMGIISLTVTVLYLMPASHCIF